jgi:CRISPR-associated protein Cas2
MIHLIVYDITNNTNRTRLSKPYLSRRLERVQYSAFRGELSPNDRDVLAKHVQRFIRDEHDCIFIIPLCRRCIETAIAISNTGVELVKDSKVEFV